MEKGLDKGKGALGPPRVINCGKVNIWGNLWKIRVILLRFICSASSQCTFHSLHGHKTFLERGFMAVLISQKSLLLVR